MLKMREVYERSPQMGDAASLEPRLEEVKQSLQRLEDELRRNQVYCSVYTQKTHSVHVETVYSECVTTYVLTAVVIFQ